MISPDRMQQLADGTEELMGKPTIIDGVDVAGCEDFSRTKTQVTVEEDCVRKCLIVPCNAIPNCYYKQLQRLKAENEELKNNYRTSCLNCEYKNTKIENEQLKAENEEIKAKLSTAETAYQICLANKENRHKKEKRELEEENEKLRAELEEEIENSDKKENELRAQLGKNNHLYKENFRKIKNDLLHINTEIAHIAQDKLTHHIIETALRGLNSGLADLIRSIKDV